MPIHTANERGAIRQALEIAGMKFSDRDSLVASTDRLRAFLLNPQAAFQAWQNDRAAAQEAAIQQAQSSAKGGDAVGGENV